MKKTLIATAIAGAMSFSVAAQAAPTVYGNIQLVVDATNDLVAADNGSTIGFKGEEAMENGLTAIYKAEFHAPAGGHDVGINDGDQSYLGVKGSFGTVRVGSFDSVANDFVGDMVYANEYVGVVGGAGIVGGEEQQIQYTGDFGALSVGASVQLNKGGDITTSTDGTVDNIDASKPGAQAMQFGVKAVVAEGISASAVVSSEDGMGFGVEAAVSGLTVGGKFETSDTVDTNIAASVSMDYAMGNAYALFNMTDTGTVDGTAFGVGATYNITNSLYAFVEVGAGDTIKKGAVVKDGAEATAFGAVMSF